MARRRGHVPLGKLGVTDFHYEPGVRIGGDYRHEPARRASPAPSLILKAMPLAA